MSSGPAPGSAAPKQDTARVAGRGFLFIAFAKLYFMISGFGLNILLPRFLERGARRIVEAGLGAGRTVAQVGQALYGDYGVVNRFTSVLNNTVVTATIQAVSKYVAEDERGAPAVRALALRMQAVIGFLLSGAYALAAGLIARYAYNDPDLARYFRIAAVILFAYSIYAVFIGYLNGTTRFSRQAGFDMTFSTVKVGSMLGVALLGYGVDALFAAFGAAAVFICIAAAVVVGVRRGDARRDLPPGVLLRAWGTIAAYNLVINLLLAVDLSVLKWAAAGAAVGLPADVVQDLSSSLSGIYFGVLNWSTIPYQAVLAVAFVVFPLVSRSTFDQDREGTKAYITNTLRYALLLVGLIGIVFAASPTELLRILNKEYEVGSTALTISIAGQVGLALFSIANAILIAAGRMGTALGIAVATAVADLVSNALVVPRFIRLLPAAPGVAPAFDPVALTAGAAATAPALGLGALLGLWALSRSFGAALPFATAGRVLLVGGVLVAACHFGPHFGLVLTVGKSILVMGAYLGGLFVLREFGPEDRARFARVVRRGGGGGK